MTSTRLLRSVLSLVAASVLLPSAHAQAKESPDADPWSLSVLGGLGSSSLNLDGVQPSPVMDPRNSYSAGLALARSLTSRWSLELGVHYAERGARWSAPVGTDGPQRLDIRATYLELPATAAFRINNSRAFHVHVQFGALVASNGVGELREQGGSRPIGVVHMEQIETSALLGAQISSRTRIPVFARVRYQHGLSDATSDGLARSRATVMSVGATLLRW